jgi:hypothetical protein
MSPPTTANPVLNPPPTPQWALPSPPSVTGDKVISPCIGITCPCGQSLQKCLVLEQFHCTFDRLHGYVLCIPHGCLVPASHLLPHLSKQHISDFEGLQGPANRIVKKVQAHLQESYGLGEDQKTPNIGWTLKHLIPGNRDIAFSRLRRCPDCPALFAEPCKFLHHTQSDHPNRLGSESRSWEDLSVVDTAQRPFEGWEHFWYEVLDQHPLAEGATAALTLRDIRLPCNSPSPLPPPLFCQELGYVPWVQSLGNLPIYNLLAIPRIPLARNTPGMDGLLETILLRVHTFLEEYLGSGEQWLFSHHRKFQGIFRKGYDPPPPSL